MESATLIIFFSFSTAKYLKQINTKMKHINCKTAKNIPLVQILSKLNASIQKLSGQEIWYLSPLKLEKTASFKINTKHNIWYDHSLGMGGDGIKLIQTIKECDVKTALEFLTKLLTYLLVSIYLIVYQ